MTKIGKIRKLNSKLIDVSRHPNYEGADNYMTMLPQRKYCYFSPAANTSKSFIIDEAFKVKSSLAKRKIQCDIRDISDVILDTKLTGLPKGGEGLLSK